MNYLNDFSLEIKDNPAAIVSLSNHQNLPKDCIVLPGKQIFEFLKEKTASWKVEEWERFINYFDDLIFDIYQMEPEDRRQMMIAASMIGKPAEQFKP